MIALSESLLALLPKWLRYTIVVIALALLIPIKAYEKVTGLIDSRVYAVVTPMKEKRDIEVTNMKQDISDMKTDIRDIRNHLIGPRKAPYESVKEQE